MSDINHEAAKEWASLIHHLKGPNAHLSRAYLDLDAKLTAERQRGDRLAELVEETINRLLEEEYPDWREELQQELTAIMENRDNG